MNWVYASDHPDLLDTLNSSSDVIDAGDWTFETNVAPDSARVVTADDTVGIETVFSPRPGWTLTRSATVHNTIPVVIDFASQLAGPSTEATRAVKSARMCGVRMRTAGFVDYSPAQLVDKSNVIPFDSTDGTMPPGKLRLDNGYIQFDVQSDRNAMVADDVGDHAAIYLIPQLEAATLRASCSLTISGRSQWAAPVMQVRQE
ncbi:MAG: hypothetical protein ACYC3X_17075 [Pirellulaceae bacterium]